MKGGRLVIRVLHWVYSMDLGGIQTFIMAIYRSLDKRKVQFDFLVEKKDAYFSDEIIQLGGRIYEIPGRRQGMKKNRESLEKFFSEHKEYKAVHMHISSLSYIMPIVVAKKHGVNLRIIHSHNSNVVGKFDFVHKMIHKINQASIDRYCNKKIACSKEASKWMFNTLENVLLFPNAIDSKKFSYNEDSRRKIRSEFGIKDDEILLGNIGRFSTQKNYIRLIDIFSAFHKEHPNAKLLMTGDGALRGQIREKVIEKGLSEGCIFAGNRNDCHKIFSALDAFVMPSLYEGLPVTLVEAQSSNIPCVVSDTITRDVDFEGKIKYVSLVSDDAKWVTEIEEALKISQRYDNSQVIISNSFDNGGVAQELEDIYIKAYEVENA